MLLLLRLSTYPRDRYRAIHYGVPDLGEFLKGLDSGLHKHRVRVPVNAYMDKPTVSGLKRYPRLMHLRADGVAGPATFVISRAGLPNS